jgi:hypothetical protein
LSDRKKGVPFILPAGIVRVAFVRAVALAGDRSRVRTNEATEAANRYLERVEEHG